MWIEERNGYFRMYERYCDPVTGKRHKASVKFKKDTPQQRNKAKERLDKIVERRETYHYGLSFRALTEFYLHAKQKEVKPSTHRRNEYECDRLLDILGDIDVDEFTAGYVKAKLMKHNSKPVTVNEHIQRFKEIIKWGFQNDFVEEIMWLEKLTKLKDISKRQKVKDKFLEKEECKKLLKAMGENHRNITEFMLLSGMRVGEVLALRESDLDFKNMEITVNKTRDAVTNEIGSPKTAASIRQVDMQPALCDLCKRIIDYKNTHRHEKGDWLFWDKNGMPMKYAAYNKYLKQYARIALGREISTHYLRHTHASLLAAEGMDYEKIQRRLGHENSNVTKAIYIHFTSDVKKMDKEAMNRITLL